VVIEENRQFEKGLSAPWKWAEIASAPRDDNKSVHASLRAKRRDFVVHLRKTHELALAQQHAHVDSSILGNVWPCPRSSSEKRPLAREATAGLKKAASI
jgi:hypothetical protein